MLIAEKNDMPGGNCPCRTTGGRTFDLDTHQLPGADDGGMRAELVKVNQIMPLEDLERLTNSSEGAMYGWANTPDRVLMRRMKMRSPVERFSHTGRRTCLGTGVTTAIISGWMPGNLLERRSSLLGKITDRFL